MLPILQEYLEVPDERNLPPLWHQWSNCTKRQELMVLTELLSAYARGPESFVVTAPIPSTKVVQDLLAFAFVGDTPDDIKTGIQPFMIAEGTAEHRQANMEVARLYGLINSGEQSLLLSDLEQLKNKEVKSLPMNYFELERNLGMFGNFLGTVLGSAHALTTTYRTFWNLLFQGYRSKFQQVIDVKLYIKPAHILRSVQLVCYNWFAQRRARLVPQPPEFTPIIYNIVLNTYVLPNLPQPVYRLAYPWQGIVQGVLGTYTPSTASLSGSGTASVSSSVSGLTNPTQISISMGVQSHDKRKGSFQANLTPDRALQQLIPYGTTIKDLMGTDPPPTPNDSSPICLSYYIRNGCWSTCKRAHTHNRILSPVEKAKLESYVQHQSNKLRQKAGSVATPQP
jgi:hypothetical protein